MDFCVLGPLEVRDVDGVVLVRSGRERALLSLLLLNENEIISIGDLVESLWGRRPPRSARKLLHTHVSQLRRLLEPGARRGEYRRLQTRPPGYLLRVEHGELDRHRFEALLGEAQAERDPAASLALVRAALALWRGTPLREVAQVHAVRTEVARLSELRLLAVCARIDRELELGLHANVVAELEALIVMHPHRDDLRGRLELALDRSGRYSEARRVPRGLAPAHRPHTTGTAWGPQREPAGSRGVAILGFRAHRGPRAGAAATVEAEPGIDVRKTVTILFTDLVGSSQLSLALDPEAFRGLLDRYFGELSAIVRRHGGTVEKFIGDAMMAVFGVPALHEDDALRAVRAAVEMRARLVSLNAELEEGWGVRLANRIGVNTGEVIAGDHRQGHLFVTGTAVNVAKRLEELAAVNGILIGEATFRLVRDAVVASPSGPHVLKHGETILAHAVVDVAPGTTAPARRFDSLFVGRERECAGIAGAFDRAVRGRSCQLVTVFGEAGVGKSRLVREFSAGLPADVMVVRGRCLPYGEGITYWPLAEIVREIVRADSRDGRGDDGATLTARLAGDEKAALIADRVAEAIGLGDAGRGTSEETFWAVRRLFEALARTRPLVVLLDDLHWAEPTFLDLCEHVVDVSRSFPILLVGIARPELLDMRPRWAIGRSDATSIHLKPFTDVECGELISNLLHRAALPPELAAAIAGACAGNALYAEEFVAMLIDEALLVCRDGRWVTTSDLSEMPVPATIDALLSARLEGLPADERAVLCWASVEGEVFHRRAVTELARPALETAIEAGLAELVRRDLIHPGGADFVGEPAYRFRHVLIRDAAYRSLPKRERAYLHERYARWLELTAGDRVREFEEILGYHFEQAFQCHVSLGARGSRAAALATRASEKLEAAGRRALVRSDLHAAIGLLERVAALFCPDDPRRAPLLTEIGGALTECGRLEEAAEVFGEAELLATAADDRCAASHVLVQQQFLRLLQVEEGGMEEAARAAQQAIVVFEDCGDDLGLCRALRLEAWLHWNEARAEAAADSWERAAVHARQAGDRHECDEILTWIASSMWFGPTRAAEGIRRCEEMRDQVRGSPESEAAILRHLAGLYAMVGRFALARDLLATSNATYAELGLSLSAATSQNEAVVELLAGDPVAAEKSLWVGYRALETMGERAYRSTTAALLARAMLDQGRDRAADDLAQHSAELTASGDALTQILWRCVRARVLARRARIDDAEAVARMAVRIASTTDFLNYRADAILDLAEVLAAGRRHGEAAVVAAEALRYYEQKGNIVAAGLARRRLVEFAQM
jgi:predicted ATPase/class 3 adenylate cyclase/DNA-binding SARP family transcriptional activator